MWDSLTIEVNLDVLIFISKHDDWLGLSQLNGLSYGSTNEFTFVHVADKLHLFVSDFTAIVIFFSIFLDFCIIVERFKE